jgi:hypothetical protein
MHLVVSNLLRHLDSYLRRGTNDWIFSFFYWEGIAVQWKIWMKTKEKKKRTGARAHTGGRAGQKPRASPSNTKRYFLLGYVTCQASAPDMAKVDS